MKNKISLLLLLAIVGFPVLSQAQLSKGDHIISGTFNLTSESSSVTNGGSVLNGPKTTNVNIGVSGMRLINEEAGPGALGLGVRLSLQNNIFTEQDDGVTVTYYNPVYEIAPFVRSYFTNTNNLGLFAEGVVGLNFGNQKVEEKSSNGTVSANQTMNGYNINARPGFNYFLTDNIGLEFIIGSVGYQSSTTQHTSTTQSTESDFGIRFDLSTIQIGVLYKL